jgi:hypothetical protein
MPRSLNASFPIHKDRREDAKSAMAMLPGMIKHRIIPKLAKSGIVHSARFVYLEEAAIFQILTVYDHEFDFYVDFFRKDLPELFKILFALVDPAPLGPDGQSLLARAVGNSDDFIRVLRAYDAPVLGEVTWSAFGSATVQQILAVISPEDLG